MFDIGMPEVILVGLVVLLLFGPQKLPEMARTLGKGMQKLKKAQAEFQNEMNTVKEDMKVRKEDLKEDPFVNLKKNAIKNVEDLKEGLKVKESENSTDTGDSNKENDSKDNTNKTEGE